MFEKKVYADQRYQFKLYLLIISLLLFSVFVTAGNASASWYSPDWAFRQQITINSALVPGDLTNFPVLVSTTDPELIAAPTGNVGKINGGDILFTGASGIIKLDHEIESYNSSTGELIVWVEVPFVSSTTNTVIYMYYGNPGASDQWNVSGTWDEEGNNSFIMVQHLNESPNDGEAGHIDRSPISSPKMVPYNFIPQNFQDGGVGTTNAVGKIGGADRFDGTNDFLASDPALIGGNRFRNVYFVDHWSNVPADPDRNGTWTLSAWVKTPTAGRNFFSEGRNAIVAWNRIEINPSGQFHSRGFNSSWSTTHNITSNATGLNDNTWKYLVLAYDNGDLDMYIDGILDQNSFLAPIGNIHINHTAIGSWRRYYSGAWQNFSFWDGFIDEVRASKIKRSSDWIAASFNNQNNPSSFLTFTASSLSVPIPAISGLGMIIFILLAGAVSVYYLTRFGGAKEKEDRKLEL